MKEWGRGLGQEWRCSFMEPIPVMGDTEPRSEGRGEGLAMRKICIRNRGHAR